MRILIAAVGTWKPSPERALYDHYRARLPWPVELVEVEAPSKLPLEKRREKECELLLAACEKRNIACRVALDETGKSLTSPQLAQTISRFQVQGHSSLAFLIGGADGLSDQVRRTAQMTLCFGTLTWPHLLVRGLLAEQLYRAQSILAGHPYHRN